MRYSFLLFGAVFGFVLSRAGATTYDYYAKLFLFQDLQLMWVIGVAAAVGAIGVAVLKRIGAKALVGGEPISFEGKPWKRGLTVGSLMFGVGWGLAGACPGTALAMLGEGKLMAGFSVVGILLGTYAYGRLQDEAPARDVTRPEAGQEASSPPVVI
ncbi:MAG: YeeE/YedE family protein [Myxococcales bacterium]|nr:YeeE/YedE family protein [Myxococcales bacterium]